MKSSRVKKNRAFKSKSPEPITNLPSSPESRIATEIIKQHDVTSQLNLPIIGLAKFKTQKEIDLMIGDHEYSK